MNSIQILNRINFYNDMSRAARFYMSDINAATNSAILKFVDKLIGDREQQSPDYFQATQRIRDELFSLIVTVNLSPTNGSVVTNRYYSYTPSHITLPNDFYDEVTINCLIDGVMSYARVVSYNENGPLFEDSFKHPTNVKPYYNEDYNGIKIYRGVGGTFSSCVLEYVKFPATFNCGSEDLLINPGNTLLIGIDYIATEVSVHAGTTYQIGDQFTASTINLASGQVIIASQTTTTDLPEKVHDQICKMASEILLGITSNIQQSMFSGKEASES